MRVSCPKSSFKWTWPRVWPRCARTHKLARYCTVHLFCLSLKKKINLKNHREEKDSLRDREDPVRWKIPKPILCLLVWAMNSPFDLFCSQLVLFSCLLPRCSRCTTVTQLYCGGRRIHWRKRGWARAARLFQTLFSPNVCLVCVCVLCLLLKRRVEWHSGKPFLWCAHKHKVGTNRKKRIKLLKRTSKKVKEIGRKGRKYRGEEGKERDNL